ncbi:MAG TPA: hypothetical protein VMW29_02575 [Candidatus Bathyarchaeia archaeon]|nr:hypothetical protein [Candidatus Bathyarchaeia archaeon]
MIKKLFLSLFSLVLFLLLALPAFGQENKINLYFFWSQSCPHCAREKIFLEKLDRKYPQLNIVNLEISQAESIELWKEAGTKLGIGIGPTPLTIIGNHHFVGFLDEKTTGEQIEKAVKDVFKNGCTDIFQKEPEIKECLETEKNIPETIKLPILGEVRTKNISLPLLTLVLGLLDGFNPCAMWTLLFLISLLLGMENRKKMWILGSAFIVTSAAVYYLFMAAWLNFFLFAGIILWIRILIGLVALAAGGFNIREYFKDKEGGCKVVQNEKRKKTFEKLRAVTQQPNFFIGLAGIILLAFAVNLVELICSAGLPAVYTQVLSLNKLPLWKYYSYLLGYIFFYMFDDLVVFFIAMVTLKAFGIESKYARFSRLFGGVVMLLIGILLIFKHEWLMFG